MDFIKANSFSDRQIEEAYDEYLICNVKEQRLFKDMTITGDEIKYVFATDDKDFKRFTTDDIRYFVKTVNLIKSLRGDELTTKFARVYKLQPVPLTYVEQDGLPLDKSGCYIVQNVVTGEFWTTTNKAHWQLAYRTNYDTAFAVAYELNTVTDDTWDLMRLSWVALDDNDLQELAVD